MTVLSSSRFALGASLLALLCASLDPRAADGAEAADLVAPPGYTVERVAEPPGVRFPMFATFDEQGRLYVAESSGLDLYAELQKLSRTCRISRLEDRDGDGRFERAQVFVDQLVFPMGLAWHDGRLYVADPPNVVAFEDRDGDGRADRRTVILGDFGHLDNGSLHGLIFGPDGWLYMTMGQPDGYRFTRPDGTIISGKSGALIRCRPDGSDVEVLCRGFENLVEIDFQPAGEIIGTDNWFYLPASGVRDALVHLLPGGLYPTYLHDVGSPMLVSGEPLPCISVYPAVAFSGMTRCRSDAFPGARGCFFTAQHNTRKVIQHRFQRSGGSFQSADTDFISTQDPDFHPSDVLEDADGSLLVIDTGSWYIHHCPTGRIRHVPAPGGVYRVRYSQSQAAHDPRGLSLNWTNVAATELAARLLDPRAQVRSRAAEQAVARRQAALRPVVDLLAGGIPPERLEDIVWVLARLPGGTAPLLGLLHADDPEQVALAARALGRAGGPGLGEHLAPLLLHPAAPVRLAAAEALASCGTSEVVPAVLRAVAANEDRSVEHSLVNVLYKRADRTGLLRALDDPSPRVQRAALVLLDQFPHHALPSGAAVSRLFSPDNSLRQAARAAVTKHPEWADLALPAFRQIASSPEAGPSDLALLVDSAVAFHTNALLANFVSQALQAGHEATGPARGALLEALTRLPSPQVPASWIDALRQLLGSAEKPLLLKAVRVARVLQTPRLDPALERLAREPDASPELRAEAIAALIRRHPALDEAQSRLLLSRLERNQPASVRLNAAEVLSQALLPRDALLRFAAAARSDPIIAPTLVLAAAERSPAGATALPSLLSYLESFVESGGSLSATDLRWVERSAPPVLAVELDRLRQRLAEQEDRQRRQLEELAPLLTGGDPNRGQDLFIGKATCATCHRVGQHGGLVGPDLTRIGAIRAGRDLLESLVAPSATFAQGYEPYVVVLKNGDSLSGVRVRQPDESFVLREAGGNEQRLDSSQIESVQRSRISIMPEGLLQTLGKEEIRDLLAYLQNLK